MGGVNDDRDDLEKLLDKAFERKMPVLGKCRGMQVMNVFGVLWPDIGQGGFDGEFIVRVRAVNLNRDIPRWTEVEGKEFEVTSHHQSSSIG